MYVCFVCVVACMCMCARLFGLHPLLLSSRGLRTLALSCECKIDQANFGCPSYHQTSWRKSALIQNPSAQIPKAFNQYGIAGKKN